MNKYINLYLDKYCELKNLLEAVFFVDYQRYLKTLGKRLVQLSLFQIKIIGPKTIV